MCGILGIASREPVADRHLFARMRDTLAHRGPDGTGEWWSADGRVGLEHRRLAIIDLSAGGRQPMGYANDSLRITLNGEIYNYRDLKSELLAKGHTFTSASDTEVLLAAYREWGTGCLERLTGMFAFGLYDSRTRTLFLARDRGGERPLFYTHDGHRLMFSSELKAMLAHPSTSRVVSARALDFYLAYGYVPGDLCIFDGMHKLPPAHALTYRIDDGAIRIWQYWELPRECPNDDADVPALLDELEPLLTGAVRRQLLAADVPVGVLLSGGLDSSLVTALAAGSSDRPVKTFTVAFPGSEVDESPYAAIVARHFGTDHTEIVAEPTTIDLLPVLARQYDEPIADSSMIPTYLVSRAIRQHATVALGGDGGDELFGGYLYYRMLLAGERVRARVPRPVRRVAASLASHLPVGFRGRNHLMGFARDFPHRVAHVNLYFDAATRRRLVRRTGRAPESSGPGPERYRASLCDVSASALRQATEADFRTTMVEAYLVKVDRASMLNSLEVRAPFLDHRVVEFAFGRVPARLRATNRENKVLLKALGRRLLPPELDLDRKQGFSLPLTEWLGGQWKAKFEEILIGPAATFDRGTVRGLLEGQRRGYANTARLYALAFFELWRLEHNAIGPELDEAVVAAQSPWPAYVS